MSVPYGEPVWNCGVCGCKGPWMLTLWWLDASRRHDVPGGVTVWEPEEPRMARACSMACGRRFAEAAGRYRISITRPERDMQRLAGLAAALRNDRNQRRAA